MELQFTPVAIAPNPVFNMEAGFPAVNSIAPENVFPKKLLFNLIQGSHNTLSIAAERVFPSVIYFNLITIPRDKIEFDNAGEAEFDGSGNTQFYN